MSAQHTETPWALREDGVIHTEGNRWGVIPLNLPWVESAFIPGASGHDVAVANAAHIVLCVNAHEAMKEALKKFLSRYPEYPSEETAKLFADGRAALKLAEPHK